MSSNNFHLLQISGFRVGVIYYLCSVNQDGIRDTRP